MKKVKIFLMALTSCLILGLSINEVTAQTTSQVVTGLKTPRLTTAQRNTIADPADPTAASPAAKGVVIFNTETDQLQYWDGEKWVNTSGDMTILMDSISHHITEQFIDSIMVHIHYPGLVDSITHHITNNFADSVWVHMNYPSVIDTLSRYITNNFVDSIATHVTDNFVDSIMHRVTIVGENGIEVTRNGERDFHIALPEGSQDGQILEWNETAGKWVVSNSATQNKVKELTITLTADNTLSTESLVFEGLTTSSTRPIKILNVQPVITGNSMMKRTLLQVSANGEVNNGKIEWNVNIKNNNIDEDSTCTLSKIILSYICEEELSSDPTTINIYQQVGW